MCIDHVLGRVTGNEVEMESNKNNYSRHVEKRWSTFSFHLFCEGRGLYEAEKDVVESHWKVLQSSTFSLYIWWRGLTRSGPMVRKKVPNEETRSAKIYWKLQSIPGSTALIRSLSLLFSSQEEDKKDLFLRYKNICFRTSSVFRRPVARRGQKDIR